MHLGHVTTGRVLRHSILQAARCASSKIYTGYTSQQNLLGWQQRQQLKKENETAAGGGSQLSSGSLVADLLIKEKLFEVSEIRKDEEKLNHVTEVARMLKSQDKIHTIFREYEESIRSMAKQTAHEKPIQTDLLCPGCGAELHSIEPTRAGYVNNVRFAEFFSEARIERPSDFTRKRGRRKRRPSKVEDKQVKGEEDGITSNAEQDELTSNNQKVLRDAPQCDRCTVLQKYKLALNVSVSESAYATIMRHIRANKQPACVLVVVDVTDLPFSIPTNLVDAFDSELHRFIIVVTKCDRVGLPISAIDPSQCGNSEQLGLVRMDSRHQIESENESSLLASNSQGSVVESESEPVIKSILRDQIDTDDSNANLVRGVTPVETRRTVLLRWMREVLRSVESRARISRSQVDAVSFVSARTGFGIDALVSSILQQQRKRNIYLVGAANAGKSSLFNALAASDLCNANVRAAQLVQRATVSTFPGTTIGLLRFPITQLTPKRTAVRDERLNIARSSWVRQWTLSRNRVAPASQADSRGEVDTDVDVDADDTKLKHSDKYRLSAPVVQSLDAAVILNTDEYQVADELATYSAESGSKANAETETDGDKALCIFETQKNEQTVKEEHTRLRFGVRPEQFAHARWCLDTPGIVQRDHLAHALNQRELERLLSGDVWLPRTFRLRPGLTMFLAGLVRIDFLEPGDPIYVTIFSSCRALICQTELAESFYYDHLDKLMQLPKRTRAPEEHRADLFVDPDSSSCLPSTDRQMSNERKLNATSQFNTVSPVEMNFINPLDDQQKLLFSSLPSLVAHRVALRGVGYRESCADIALSHVGWCAITARRAQTVSFRVFTLGGHGFSVRAPLLPFAVNERGPKIRGTVEYKLRR